MSVIDFNIEHTDEPPAKPLADIGNDLLVSATISFNPTLPTLAGIGFKLSASANGKVEVYNEETDKDEDGVLGKGKEDEDASGTVGYADKTFTFGKAG